MPRALIIGAGVAGTAAALALQKAGWEAEIFEAYERSAGLNQGAFLTIAVNGLDALRAIDADHVVSDLGFETGKIRFLSGTGKSLGAMNIGPNLPDGTVTRTVRRADLYRALYALAVERGIAIQHDRRLRNATSSGGQVEATFEDGGTASGDVLIGADGLRSTVRPLIDPAAPVPQYSGMGNVGAFARSGALDVATEAADGDYRMVWGRRCFFGYTVSPTGEVWWFANPPAAKEISRDQLAGDGADELRRKLVAMLAVDAGKAAHIVGATQGPILFSNQYVLARVPVWHRDKLILIGDAAHAVSPATGQGVSLAIEDAVVLARCLRDNRTISSAFDAYEAARRTRVDRIAAWGSKLGSSKTVGPVARVTRDLLLPLILSAAASPKAMEKQAWMFRHHVEWAS